MAQTVNRGNLWDIENNRDYRNYNPNNHKMITKDIIDFYIQYPDKCEICPLDYHSRYLKLDVASPDCIDHCRFAVHRCGGNGGGTPKPVVETRVRIPGHMTAPERIFITRAMLLWLYYHKTPIVFRASKNNGYIMHHKNRNPFDDRPENIVIILGNEHVKLHGNIRRVDNSIAHLEDLIRTDPVNEGFRKLLEQQSGLKTSIMSKVVTDAAVFEYIKGITP
ncbi:MAG: hypothetical protein ACTSX1_15145 [Candidatus Heimdallarchaeaceae archaeon]